MQDLLNIGDQRFVPGHDLELRRSKQVHAEP